MDEFESTRRPLSEDDCRRFAALAMLDRLANEPRAWHASLIERQDDYLLEPVFDYMLREGLVEIGADDHYRPTAKGRAAYRRMLLQQQSYLYHFDIFAGVDLAEGEFADPDVDDAEDSRWSDLRVAVAEYKGVDAARMVLLSMLADESFFEKPGWKFDIVLGSSFFKELEEIVAAQITVEELAYEAEDGTWVPGEAVIEDVILQGAQLNHERLLRETERQPSLLAEEDVQAEASAGNGDAQEPEEAAAEGVTYEPWGALEGYAADPHFVEAIWLGPYW